MPEIEGSFRLSCLNVKFLSQVCNILGSQFEAEDVALRVDPLSCFRSWKRERRTVRAAGAVVSVMAMLVVCNLVYAHMMSKCKQSDLPAVLRSNVVSERVTSPLPRAVTEHIYDPSELVGWREWEKKYNSITPMLDNRKVELGKEMLDSLHDPYSFLVEPAKASQERDRETQNKFFGIGFDWDLATKPDTTGKKGAVITKLFRNSPAEEAGLCPGDTILEFDGHSLQGKSREEIDRIFSVTREGPVCKMTVLRRDLQLSFAIARRYITFEQASWRVLPGNVGYVRLWSFLSSDTVEQLKSALRNLSHTDSIILDLRNNPGGRVSNAFAVTSLFMEQGAICSMKQRVPGDPSRPVWSIDSYFVRSDGIYEDSRRNNCNRVAHYRMPRQPCMMFHRPLIILVNRGSASASEFTVGALKDNHAGVVVGESTFGKGVGQSILEMCDGTRLHITSLRYITPSGYWPGDGAKRAHGIRPNIEVKQSIDIPLESDQDKQLKTAIRLARLLARSKK